MQLAEILPRHLHHWCYFLSCSHVEVTNHVLFSLVHLCYILCAIQIINIDAKLIPKISLVPLSDRYCGTVDSEPTTVEWMALLQTQTTHMLTLIVKWLAYLRHGALTLVSFHTAAVDHIDHTDKYGLGTQRLRNVHKRSTVTYASAQAAASETIELYQNRAIQSYWMVVTKNIDC